MPIRGDGCPPELAERYVLGFLSPEDAVVFEDHYRTCPHCADVVQATDDYVRAIRAAAWDIRIKQRH